MYLRIHDTKEGKIVAVCDEDLIGKVIREGDTILDLDKYNTFYKGKTATEKDVKEALRSFHSANLVGKKSVAVAMDSCLVSKSEVLYASGVPYVHIYKM